jgi:competence protein ComEC
MFGENSFLFTGDAYESAEKEILDRGLDVNSDILKVAHHGSKTSSSEEFIAKVSPESAVISVGKENSYGHPNPEVLEIFKKFGIKVLRTDLDGDIKIICDGKNYEISNL